MKKWKRATALCIIVSLILALSACGGTQKPQENGTSVGEDSRETSSVQQSQVEGLETVEAVDSATASREETAAAATTVMAATTDAAAAETTESAAETTATAAEATTTYIDPERGVLKVTDVTPEEFPPILPILPEGSYHLYDYQFFFRNLQQNVDCRINSYLRNKMKEKE